MEATREHESVPVRLCGRWPGQHHHDERGRLLQRLKQKECSAGAPREKVRLRGGTPYRAGTVTSCERQLARPRADVIPVAAAPGPPREDVQAILAEFRPELWKTPLLVLPFLGLTAVLSVPRCAPSRRAGDP